MAESFNWNYEAKKLRVADLNVELNIGGKRMEQKISKYLYDFKGDSDIKVCVKRDFIRQRCSENKNLNPEDAEYMLTGTSFYSKLVDFEGIMLHASAVAYQNRAYLFSAPCGTGKSTHASIWMKIFPESVILNDDKPALRCIGEKVFAYGTPWSGKTDIQQNISAPVAGIAFIERSKHNSVERMDKEKAVINILSQTIGAVNVDRTQKLATTVEKIIKNVPVYLLKCNMDDEAAIVAYSEMSKYE